MNYIVKLIFCISCIPDFNLPFVYFLHFKCVNSYNYKAT